MTLTSLTSMIGFGSMVVAAHQRFVSLGTVLVIGVGSCLFVSLVTLPSILTLIDRTPPQQNDESGKSGSAKNRRSCFHPHKNGRTGRGVKSNNLSCCNVYLNSLQMAIPVQIDHTGSALADFFK